LTTERSNSLSTSQSFLYLMHLNQRELCCSLSLASGHPPSRNSILRIVFCRPCQQVTRVHAWRVVTNMTNYLFLSKRSIMQLKKSSMSPDRSAFVPRHTISSRVLTSRPHPATRFVNYVIQDWRRRSIMAAHIFQGHALDPCLTWFCFAIVVLVPHPQKHKPASSSAARWAASPASTLAFRSGSLW
jgi:hypothetical protein